jgi:hypothetical protein
MLKPADPAPPPAERPVGELIQQLVEEGKAYARAEIGLAKAIAAAKGKALILPAILFGAALILALAAVTALAVGVVIALAKFVGPLLAGIVGLLVFGGGAAGLGWYGAERVKRVL